MNKKEPIMEESIQYRKKSQTASTSKSGRRSDHKHDYNRVIVKSFLGFQWGRRCSICGRVDESYWLHTFQRHLDFMKPQSKGKPGISASDYLTLEEIHQKYPAVPVIELDGSEYKEI